MHREKHPLPWHEQILAGTRFRTDETYVTGTGQLLLNVHTPDMCAGQEACVIHNPSMHPLRGAPTHWRIGGRFWFVGTQWEVGEIMERICKHQVHHPDPDDLVFIAQTKGDVVATRLALHECCGCCGVLQ